MQISISTKQTFYFYGLTMTSDTHGEGGTKQIDDLFDQVDAETQPQEEETAPDDSTATPDDSETDSNDQKSTAEPPSEHSEAEVQKEDSFSDLFPKTQEKEVVREKSAKGQFKAYTTKVLEETEDFEELSPWIKKGVRNTLLEMVENDEIDVEDIPTDIQDSIAKKLNEKKESEKKKLEQQKEESEIRVKTAELKILSREIPEEAFNRYMKSVKSLLKDMPTASMERIHHLAKLENGITDSKETKRKGVSVQPPKRKPVNQKFIGGKNVTADEIRNSDPAEVTRWLIDA